MYHHVHVASSLYLQSTVHPSLLLSSHQKLDEATWWPFYMFMYRQVVHSCSGHWPSNERYTEVLTGLTSSFSLLVIEHVSSKSACTLYMYKSRSEGGESAISISTHVWLGFSGTY